MDTAIEMPQPLVVQAPTPELSTPPSITLNVRRINDHTGEFVSDLAATERVNQVMLPLFSQLESYLSSNGTPQEEVTELLENISSNFCFDVVPSTPYGALAQVEPGRFIVTESVLNHPESGRDILPHEILHLSAAAESGFAVLGRSVNATLNEVGYRTDEDAGQHRNLPPESKGDVGKAVEEALAEVTKLDIFPGSQRYVVDENGRLMYTRQCDKLISMFHDLSVLSGLDETDVRQQIVLLSAQGKIAEIPNYIEQILGGEEGYGLVYLGTHFVDVGFK